MRKISTVSFIVISLISLIGSIVSLDWHGVVASLFALLLSWIVYLQNKEIKYYEKLNEPDEPAPFFESWEKLVEAKKELFEALEKQKVKKEIEDLKDIIESNNYNIWLLKNPQLPIHSQLIKGWKIVTTTDEKRGQKNYIRKYHLTQGKTIFITDEDGVRELIKKPVKRKSKK